MPSPCPTRRSSAGDDRSSTSSPRTIPCRAMSASHFPAPPQVPPAVAVSSAVEWPEGRTPRPVLGGDDHPGEHVGQVPPTGAASSFTSRLEQVHRRSANCRARCRRTPSLPLLLCHRLLSPDREPAPRREPPRVPRPTATRARRGERARRHPGRRPRKAAAPPRIRRRDQTNSAPARPWDPREVDCAPNSSALLLRTCLLHHLPGICHRRVAVTSLLRHHSPHVGSRCRTDGPPSGRPTMCIRCRLGIPRRVGSRFRLTL